MHLAYKIYESQHIESILVNLHRDKSMTAPSCALSCATMEVVEEEAMRIAAAPGVSHLLPPRPVPALALLWTAASGPLSDVWG